MHDWHATFLTDPRTMAAARDRANTHGEDGWAAAYTLALTMPPASGSLQAGWARDVLVPDTLPDAAELARLARAAPEGDDAPSGYYGEPNIDFDNPDMSASMVRRARPDETVRPDLRCPACCASAGDPEEVGMVNQAYRCTECSQSWEYVPEVDDDDLPLPSALDSYVVIMPSSVRENLAHFQARYGQQRSRVAAYEESPSVETDWTWSGWTSALAEAPLQTHRSEAEIDCLVTRTVVARAFGIPEEMLGDTTPRLPDLPPDMRGGVSPLSYFLDEAFQESTETDDLRNALEFASRNPTSQRADQHDGMAAARRQRLVIDLPARWSRQTRRVYLTRKGKATLLRLCRPRATR